MVKVKKNFVRTTLNMTAGPSINLQSQLRDKQNIQLH